MFNPLKMIGNVQAMGKIAAMQKELEKEEAEGRDGNVKVIVNGKMEVKLVEIDGVANEQVKRACNDAMKRVQQIIAGKAQELAKTMNL
jgi:DNA-binding protein YbaB